MTVQYFWTMPAMNLSRLEVYVSVCDTGSFTRAAERLAITKSAASQQVATLERELGVQLMHRSTRTLKLTEAGEALLAEGRALLAQAAGVAERAKSAAAGLDGVLRLTSALDLTRFVAPLVAEYLERHPRMRVEYLPGDGISDLVAEGLDLSLRTTGRRDSGLRAVTLMSFDIWCAASPAYLNRHGTPMHVRDLAKHSWIGFLRLSSPWTLRPEGGGGAVRVAGRVSTSSTPAARALALAGAGVVGAPHFVLVDDVAAGRLVRVLPKLKFPKVSLYAAWPGKGEPPAKTRAFIELAKLRLGDG